MLRKIIAVTLILFYSLLVLDLFTRYEADVINNSVDTFLRLPKPSVVSAQEAADLSIKLNHNEPSYYIDRAKVRLLELPINKKEVLSDMQTAYDLNPNNLATLRNSVPYYYFLALNDYRSPALPTNIDQEYFEIAKTYYKSLESRFETDAGVLVLLRKYYKRLNLNEDVAKVDEKLMKLRPDLLDWAVN